MTSNLLVPGMELDPKLVSAEPLVHNPETNVGAPVIERDEDRHARARRRKRYIERAGEFSHICMKTPYIVHLRIPTPNSILPGLNQTFFRTN